MAVDPIYTDISNTQREQHHPRPQRPHPFDITDFNFIQEKGMKRGRDLENRSRWQPKCIIFTIFGGDNQSAYGSKLSFHEREDFFHFSTWKLSVCFECSLSMRPRPTTKPSPCFRWKVYVQSDLRSAPRKLHFQRAKII